MKKTKDKIKPADEFRVNHKTNHPEYISEKHGKRLKGRGITHAEKTRGEDNIPLRKNPDPKGKGTAYIRPTAKIQHRKMYSKVLIKWEMHDDDKKIIKEFDKQDKKKK